MAGVVLESVEKIYDNGFKAVHGINLEVEDGEFMVLVGPSGCAKSTTLRMIAGLEDISAGSISIDGKVVNDVLPKDRELAMVFQNYALYPHMTVEENMAFSLKMRKLPKDEIKEKVDRAAEILDIKELLNRKPKQLSGGQRQRVAVGRAIVRDPKVFLFDEPLSNLDAKLRVHMRVQLSELHQKLKSTMIYVTHDQVEAMTMGDRICVMNLGKIMQVDTPLNLYNYPENKFVAAFIGSPAMNMFKATVNSDGSQSVKVADYRIDLPENKINNLEEYLGKEVYIGIRPEYINIVNDDFAESYKGKVTVLEHMGNESFVYFTSMGQELIARIQAEISHKLKPGSEFNYQVESDKIHVFDELSEVNISL
ncbi:MAG: sn-glycerol-3-phosphate ABC transporter ATP-binding protein UgpC [Firmicutes bacterium]|jgi:multiple sugar transport system ATP-binding protein|nr:sn-glycerol-3-phosphate ABC transporter ATP-binding protein UgpC [Bacillota bacterium]